MEHVHVLYVIINPPQNLWGDVTAHVYALGITYLPGITTILKRDTVVIDICVRAFLLCHASILCTTTRVRT